MLTFVETKLFRKLVQEYLSDDEYGDLQQARTPKLETSSRARVGFGNCAGALRAGASEAGSA
jgi:hypothetical protein